MNYAEYLASRLDAYKNLRDNLEESSQTHNYLELYLDEIPHTFPISQVIYMIDRGIFDCYRELRILMPRIQNPK